MRWPPYLTLAILALLVGPLWAKDAPAKRLPTMADAESIAQRNLGLRMQGRPAGGVSMRLGRMRDGALLMESDFVLKLKRANGDQVDTFVVKTHSLEFYDKEGRLCWKRKHTEEGGVSTRVFTRYSPTHVEIEFEGPAMKFKKRLTLPSDFSTEYETFKLLLDKFKRGETAQAAFSTLDAKDQVFKPNAMTILRKTAFEHGGETYEAYAIKSVSQLGEGTLIADDKFLPMRVSMMGILEGEWIDDSPFEFASGGWEISSYIPVEGVAPMSAHLEKLEVTITLGEKALDDKPLFKDSRYQTVKREGDVYHLTLSSTQLPHGTKALKLPLDVAEESIKRFLAPTPQSQSGHPTIIARAQKIVGDEKDALTAVKRIVAWVYRTLDKGTGERGSATAVEVLASRVGDCTEHAALTVALCRAAGIPARNLGGLEYLVLRNDKPVAGFHAWAEVWLGRWVGIDATIPEVGTAARYILFDVDEPGEKDNGSNTIRTLTAKLRLRIDAYQHAGGERTVLKR